MPKQKPIEKISHEINVDVILKCLWAIRENDQFYFNSYGKEMIENCINQKLKKQDISSIEEMRNIQDKYINTHCKNYSDKEQTIAKNAFQVGWNVRKPDR